MWRAQETPSSATNQFLLDKQNTLIDLSLWKKLKNNPQVKMIQGHSLCGAIALPLNKENERKIDTRTNNVPIVSSQPTGETGRNSNRIRDANDLVGYFDKGAITVAIIER